MTYGLWDYNQIDIKEQNNAHLIKVLFKIMELLIHFDGLIYDTFIFYLLLRAMYGKYTEPLTTTIN